METIERGKQKKTNLYDEEGDGGKQRKKNTGKQSKANKQRQLSRLVRVLLLGGIIHYVSTHRGGGIKKPENMRTIVLIGCVKSVQEGIGGQKKAKKSAHALYGCCLS